MPRSWVRHIVSSKILARILAGFALIAAMLGVGLMVTSERFNTLNEEFYRLLGHDVALVGGIQRLKELLLTLQSDKRAYLLTGDRAFLEEYQSARDGVSIEIERVRREIPDRGDDQRDLDHFAFTFQRYTELGDAELSLRRRVQVGEPPGEDLLELARRNHSFAMIEEGQRTLTEMRQRALRTNHRQRQEVIAASALSRQVSVAILLLALVLAVFYGTVVSRDFAQALSGLRRSIEAMARGERLLAPHRDDEIGAVGRSFDAMADRLMVAEGDLVHKVTEQQRTLDELRARNASLSRVMRVKSDFLASVSNELRAPLKSVIGLSVELLESDREPLSERARAALKTMRGSGEHLLGLLNDILDLARADAGRMTLITERVELKPLVETCLATMVPLIADRPVTTAFAAEERGLAVMADAQRTRQIVLNLLSNAVKFTDRGTVTVKARREGATVRIDVEDDGIGIAESDLRRLFGDFQQVRSGDARQHAGTGLGLSLSRKMARLMRGDITVTSAEAKGSTFTLTLPAAVTESSEADRAR